jgi:hypothetical protein
MGHVRLESTVAEDLPSVWADPVRVRQILINLIDNGIKFTPRNGSVVVACSTFAEDDEFLCFSVSDTGCGISPENLERVFDRLARVDNGMEGSRNGLGLGLFIARDLVRLHGGRIWVESQLGQGSSFFFTVPVFSLAKICEQTLTTPSLVAAAALITVDIASLKGPVDAEMLRKIRRVLELCIREGQDVLLPSMSESDDKQIFFIVTCASPDGLAAITTRIRQKLGDFDGDCTVEPLISVNALPVQPDHLREEQLREVAAEIERMVETRLEKRSILNEQRETDRR